jgi:hypothetical protein
MHVGQRRYRPGGVGEGEGPPLVLGSVPLGFGVDILF